MLKKIILVAALAAWGTVGAYEWLNISPETRIGGRMISPGYLRGKVVLLDRRDYGDPKQANAIKQLQSVWATYKTKPFVLVGGHHGSSSKAKVEEAIKKLGVTFPVYDDVRFIKPDATPEEKEAMEQTWALEKPLLTIFDSTFRKKLYYGYDERAAQGVVGSAIMAAARPMAAKQWKFLLDWEVENLPGKAYSRLKEFRSQFPKDAAKYDSFWDRARDNDDIKRLAKLVELSRCVKDRDEASASAKRVTPEILEKAIEKYSDLKQNADPNIAQEAKNALADIKWSASSL